MQDDKVIVGLDIGSTKVCVVAGRKNEYGRIEILGMGQEPLEEGVVRAGVVTKIDRTTEAIKRAIDSLNATVEGEIGVGEVNVNIDNIHIKSLQQRTSLIRRNNQQEINTNDLWQLNEDMKRIKADVGYEIIHVLPQMYRVDGEGGIKDPTGMLGVRLDAEFYVVTTRSDVLHNLSMCLNRVGLSVGKSLFSPLASGLAVLSEDEKEQGVVLVDIGGGTTDIVIYQEGIVRHVAVLPFGGDSITRDIAHGCGVTRSQAEAMKLKFGVTTPETTSHQHRIVVPGLRDRQPTLVSQKVVAQIIEARLTEIIEMVYEEIVRSGYESRVRNGGIVLAGGTAQLENADALFEELTGMPTRVGNAGEHLGLSRLVALKNPAYATSVGLVVAGFRALDARENRYEQVRPTTQTKTEPAKTNGGIFGKFKNWLSEGIEDKNEY